MDKNKINMDELLSIDERQQIVDDIGQDDLMKIFKDYRPNYKPLYQKSNPLDQKIAVGITADERQLITSELGTIRQQDGRATLSSVVRSRSTGEIDIQLWREHAIQGLRELANEEYNKPMIKRNIKRYLSLLDNADDEEDELSYEIALEKWQTALQEISRPTQRRGYRMSGRVTFNEANHIRWRAGRLTLTVADYMRLLIFDYVPFSEADRHMSIDARRRFYISIIDVAENGWKDAPQIEECPNCARYARENQELQEKIRRIMDLNR